MSLDVISLGKANKAQKAADDAQRNALRAQRGLRFGLPVQAPARVTTPTITAPTNTVDAGTPLSVPATLASSFTPNPKFLMRGGNYQIGGLASPNYIGQRTVALPTSPTGFGNAIAEFLSDAPLISLYQLRTQLGVMRVLVDDVEVLRCGSAIRASTAQAGGATTITLDASASATNDIYVTKWVRITGGTGTAGEQRQISDYVGSTKVATVSKAWSVNPDNTTTYEITEVPMDYTTSTLTGQSSYYFLLNWDGERRLRHYRVECSGMVFMGCYVATAADTVMAAPKPVGTRTIWAGDSFSAGSGADSPTSSSLAKVCCDRLGWDLVNVSIGGTGYLNPGTASLPLGDRLLPPVNAWRVFTLGCTGGTFTLTQGATTTGSIAYNASLATIQTALDSAFGSGAFTAYGNVLNLFVVGNGATASVATAMTMTESLTGHGGSNPPYIEQWLGDLDPHVPLDGDGNALPFNLVLAAGHNDTTSSDAGYTEAVLEATVTSLIEDIYAAYPTATIIVLGVMYLPGGNVPSNASDANDALLAAATAACRKINGQVPFIDTISAGLFNGSGYIGNLVGTGNSDYATASDGVHPATLGHQAYGNFFAREILGLFEAA